MAPSSGSSLYLESEAFAQKRSWIVRGSGHPFLWPLELYCALAEEEDDFHLVEVNVRDSAMGNVRPSPWATRETIQRENLEGCQCQGPVGPRATTKPVRSHVPSQHRGRRFETILMAVGCVLTAALPCPSERPIAIKALEYRVTALNESTLEESESVLWEHEFVFRTRQP
uniref:Uncharacterized protein n=1 Tax=Vespula pensylvanica TaxID=30213 RepID=A0A834P525_VESPE|nr:hypothetical protein H0235_005527 [Vespula pensylvanica]